MDEREGEEGMHEQGRNRYSIRPRVNSPCMHAAAAAGYLPGAGAGRPPTLEIFPSWPMRHQQQLHSVSKAKHRPPDLP